MSNDNHKPATIPPEHLPTKALTAFQLPGPDNSLRMPASSELLLCRVYQGAPTLFFLTPETMAPEIVVRRFVVLPAVARGIRGDLTAADYVATLQMGPGDCLHIFEAPLIGEVILA
jgi:hypothetical protein